MSRATANLKEGRSGLQAWHVLTILLAFFGSIFAVNGYFIFTSLATHSGVVSEEPYRKGLGYNQRIAADDRQTGLHWQVDLDVKAKGTVKLTLADASGQPIVSRRVSLQVGRPSTRSFDRTIALTETTPGTYAVTSQAFAAGTWVADAEVRDSQSQEASYRIRRRLWLTP
jgi:nitrogen fixation protein FixH